MRNEVSACRSIGVYSPPLAGGEHKGRGQYLMVNYLLETEAMQYGFFTNTERIR